MALLKYDSIGITGISACVPKNVLKNRELKGVFTEQEIENTIALTGIEERRIATKNVCSSDLCYTAAERLLNEMNCDRQSIDLLVFLSQTPDYRQPSTAPNLAFRLGLPETCAAFDINLACSGYVYGLSVAYAFCQNPAINKALLLVGETMSKVISLKDRATSLLFGDAGTATLIERRNDAGLSYFSLNSDGSGSDFLKIQSGGYRNPSNAQSCDEIAYDDGSFRRDEQLFMDGFEVFNFTMKVVPKDLQKIIEFSDVKLDEIDYIVFHQANKQITNHVIKKMKFDKDKVPYSIGKYGNSSAPTIPLTIVTELNKILPKSAKKLILCGFGGGLSWATAQLTISNCCIPDLIEL
jgi:3-oxoacyl-[acyl-carrier-protein] synthase III